ncbi:unnamed protein product [Ophioblennius macclurei]
MVLFWLVFWSLLPGASPDACAYSDSSSSSQSVSPLLDSLRCYNDYESRVFCEWRKQRNQALQLWFLTEEGRKPCLPDGRDDGCSFEIPSLGIGITYSVFFNSVCSSHLETSLNLHHHLKALPPVNLSSHDAGGGARRLRWDSPYPSSSSLDANITYQLGYRTPDDDDDGDSWTIKDVRNSSVTLEGNLLLPGSRYEARVRARVNVGQWSDWSPLVAWRTEHDDWRPPALRCVLRGEKEVMCSWEVRAALARFLTYQLDCQRQHDAPCCENLAVSSESDGATLRYSCLLTDPGLQLLRLKPTHSVKTFEANEHIRPKPPRDVKIRKKDKNWMVHWTEPSKPSVLRLTYQVCYYRKDDQESRVLLNTSEGATSMSILGMSLAPSREYEVTVRSMTDSEAYRGIPSEWAEPVGWTSDEETWSGTTFTYILVSVFTATALLILYCTIPACQKRLLQWVDSVPSPSKSKLISEIKSAAAAARGPMLSENTYISKVQHLDATSAGPCHVLLWPTKDADEKGHDEDRDNQEANGAGKASISFSGPYIMFESLEEVLKSSEVQTEDEDTSSPPPLDFTPYGDGYVWLPRRLVSVSSQDLTSHRTDGVQDDQPGPDGPRPDLSGYVGEDRLPECNPRPSVAWPQAGAVQPSGYCHLPTAFPSAQ